MNTTTQITVPARLELNPTDGEVLNVKEVNQTKDLLQQALRSLNLQAATALLVEAFLALPTLIEIEAVVSADTGYDDSSYFTQYTLRLRGRFSSYPSRDVYLWFNVLEEADFQNETQPCNPSKWVHFSDFEQRLDEGGLDDRWIQMAHAAVPNETLPIARATLSREKIDHLLKEPVINLHAVCQQVCFEAG